MINNTKEIDDGSVSFIMSSGGIEKAIRDQQPAMPRIALWFERGMPRMETGNSGKYSFVLVRKVRESEKGVQILTEFRDYPGHVHHTEERWYPKKAIENLEMLK